MTAPIGAIVRIYYDGRAVAVGDYLVTRTGRVYEVASVRVQARGAHVGRQHLACVVRSGVPLAGGEIHPLRWYARTRRPRAARA